MYETKGYPVDPQARMRWEARPRRQRLRALVARVLGRGHDPVS